jgi:hypothetical protein
MTTGYQRRRHGWTGIDGDHGSAIGPPATRSGAAGDQVLDHEVCRLVLGRRRWNIPVADCRAVRVSRGGEARTCFPIRVRFGNVGRNLLFVPGPTNSPTESRAIRADGGSTLVFVPGTPRPDPQRPQEGLQDGAARPSCSRARARAAESALVNTLSPGDKVLSFRYGQFSHLWIDMMQRLGLDVTAVDVEWGEGAPPETIHELLSKDTKHGTRAVCVVQRDRHRSHERYRRRAEGDGRGEASRCLRGQRIGAREPGFPHG